MTVGLIPGSFDPFHNGHLELAGLRLACLARGVTSLVVQPARVGVRSRARLRVSPLRLSYRQQVRLRRLRAGALYDEAAAELRCDLEPAETTARALRELLETLEAPATEVAD